MYIQKRGLQTNTVMFIKNNKNFNDWEQATMNKLDYFEYAFFEAINNVIASKMSKPKCMPNQQHKHTENYSK